MEKILIIDDEMYPGGPSDPQYGRLSEADIAIQLINSLTKMGFETEFCQTVDEGLEMVRKDKSRQIKCVFLDKDFENLSSYQGAGGFRQIRLLREDLPIVIITKTPSRKLPGEGDIFKEFHDLGAELYIEKKYFTRRGKEYINFVNAVVKGKDIKYTLLYSPGLDFNKDEILDIDIIRKDEDMKFSILKEPHRIRSPLSDYIEQCIQSFPNPVHWKENALIREKMTSTDFARAIFKLNDVLMRKSSGRIPNFIKRIGPAGWTLNVHEIEQM